MLTQHWNRRSIRAAQDLGPRVFGPRLIVSAKPSSATRRRRRDSPVGRESALLSAGPALTCTTSSGVAAPRERSRFLPGGSAGIQREPRPAGRSGRERVTTRGCGLHSAATSARTSDVLRSRRRQARIRERPMTDCRRLLRTLSAGGPDSRPSDTRRKASVAQGAADSATVGDARRPRDWGRSAVERRTRFVRKQRWPGAARSPRRSPCGRQPACQPSPHRGATGPAGRP